MGDALSVPIIVSCSKCMRGESIKLVRVSARFELARVQVIGIGEVTRHILPHLLWVPPDPHLHVKRLLMVTFNCLLVGVRGPVYVELGGGPQVGEVTCIGGVTCLSI